MAGQQRAVGVKYCQREPGGAISSPGLVTNILYATSSIWAVVPFGRKGCFSSAGHDGGSRCWGQGAEAVVHGPSPCSF